MIDSHAAARATDASVVPPGPSPKRGRRAEILRLAAGIIADKGYRNATVRDIADRAGILSGSLYRHFDSKEHMLEEILRTYLDDVLAKYARVISQEGTSVDRLASLIRLACATAHTNRVEVAILHNNADIFDDNSRFAFVNVVLNRVKGMWLQVLEEGRVDGLFSKDIDPPLAFQMMMGSIETMTRWFDPRGRRTIDELADQYTALFLSGLLSAGGSRS